MAISNNSPVKSANTLQKVLIITYYWPPSGGAGVQRWLKFSKYLPEFGWQPIILTVDPKNAFYPQQDFGLLNDIPADLEVVHARSSTWISALYKKLTGSKEIPYGGFVNESKPGLIQKMLRFIRGNFFLPDSRIGWNKHAIRQAMKIIGERRIETLITTSPPHSSQLIGLKIKKKLNINWVADLRDPWTDIYYAGQMYQTLFARRINRSLELKVLNEADKIIVTCNTTGNLFRSKLPDNQSHAKIITITNGFDEEDYKNRDDIVPETFRITYLGTFAHNYNIDVLLRAIGNYHTSDNIKISLCFIGKADENFINYLKNDQSISVEIIPYLQHEKALDYLARSAALLLVIPSKSKAEEMIPGKLFEYMASKRPIIAIGSGESDVAEILQITKSGKIFEKGEDKELGKYIVELIDNYNKGLVENIPQSIDQYSRRNLSGKIALILKSISKHNFSA